MHIINTEENVDDKRISLAHGSGGGLMQRLIKELILFHFGNPVLNKLDDSAVFTLGAKDKKLAFTTDSFVVSPIFFPGGDIGKLSICGTVNDLAVMGAKPVVLSVGLIIEEGFEIEKLEKIIISMKKTAAEAQVEIVCGDIKVVNKGNCDKIFINTAGIGVVARKGRISASFAKPGDAIVVSGPIAEHGIAILSQRESLEFKTVLKSDCAALNGLVANMMEFASDIHVMRDVTRGGLAAVLNEIAQQSNVGIEIEEQRIPIRSQVKGACEILGLDPLYLACEGRLVAFVNRGRVQDIQNRMKKDKNGKKAEIIGKVVAAHKKEVHLSTIAGSYRILDMPIQEQTPRIC